MMKSVKKIILNIIGLFVGMTILSQTLTTDSIEGLLSSGAGTDEEKSLWALTLSVRYYDVDTAKSRIYAAESILHAKNGGLIIREGIGYRALGNIYTHMGQYYLAHSSYKKAENIFFKENDEGNLIKVYHSLMLMFWGMFDAENTKYYCEKLLELMPGSDTINQGLQAQFILGWAKYEDRIGKEALDYYLNMYEKTKHLNNNTPALIASFCGSIFLGQNNLDEALKYLVLSKNLYIRSGNKDHTMLYGTLAETHAKLQQIDSAEYYINNAITKIYIRNSATMSLYRNRSAIDSAKGDFKNALENYKNYHFLSDSLEREANTKQRAELKNWNELERIDNENIILFEQQQKREKLIKILFAALVLIFILFALSLLLYKVTIQKNRELKNLNKVKDKLFSVIANHLRTPIKNLSITLKNSSQELSKKESNQKLLKDVSNKVDETYGLVDNLLLWSKTQMRGVVASPIYFDPNEVTMSVIEEFDEVAQNKRITLLNKVEKRSIYADRDMFFVVLRNLIANAIKYSYKESEVYINSEPSGNNLIISVKDTGIGIAQNAQNTLFKLSENKSQPGTNNEIGPGLGLILCDYLVKLNNGTIWFESNKQKTTFFFEMPTICREN